MKDISIKNKESQLIKKYTLWNNKNFIYIWGANSFSNLTFYVFTFSLPVILYNYTGSSFAMSSMRALEVLPNLLLGMLIGVIVDRMNRKRVLILSVISQIICLGLILLLLNFYFNLLSLYLISFILFTSGYVFSNAYHTILPNIVSKEQLISANSAISLINTIISILGPNIASLIILVFSDRLSLWISIIGLTVLLITITLIKIPQEKIKKESKNSIKEEIKEGWMELKGNITLWIMTKMILFINISNSLTGAVLIFYSLDSISVSRSILGIIMSGAGLGSIIASLIAKKTRNLFYRGQLFLFLTGFSSLGQIILFLSNNWLHVLLGIVIINFSLILINIHYLSMRQESTPNHLLGRVSGISSMIMKFSSPFSFLSAGLLAEYISVNYIFLLSAIILIVMVVYGISKKLYTYQ